MGTWGTAIFSDDLAADVRDDWRALVGDGLPGPEATARLVREHAETLADPDERGVFWLALALTQHRAGRAEPAVLAEALRCIADGSDLARWADDPRARGQRAAALDTARRELEAPPPAPKRISARHRDACEWALGEVVGYRLPSGTWTLLRVAAFHSDRGGTSPAVEVLDWTSREPPPSLPTGELRPRPDVHADWPARSRVSRLIVAATARRQRPDARLRRLGVPAGPTLPGTVEPALVAPWPYLDGLLATHFGLT